MKREIASDHPLRHYFVETLHDSLATKLAVEASEEVEAYLSDLMVSFMDMDNVFKIRDPFGAPVHTIAEMVVEGDVRLNASSFDREREVHRHIGDFLLFWSGLFPEFLNGVKAAGNDVLLNPVQQGRYSYHVVSTFDHDPYAEEAPLFEELSRHFEDYRYGLSLVRASFEGFARQGWMDGFQA